MDRRIKSKPHDGGGGRGRAGAASLLLFLFAHLPSFDSPPPTLTATTKQRQLTEGKVVAVGPGRRAPLSGEVIPVSVKEGDTVLLPEYGGTPLKHEGKELLLYRDDELLGVLH
jgi:co-chaperonin GroES (HSP10)